MAADSTNRGQESGSPVGVMPPYSIPLSPTAVSNGANDALRESSWRRTTPFTSTRVVEGTRHAARVGPAAALAGHDHTVRRLFEQLPPVVLHEDGGVRPFRSVSTHTI
jgi:hypothetical protein